MPRTQSSGRSTIRWARAGTATALMSSGLDEVPAIQQGPGPSQFDHGLHSSWAGPGVDLGVGPGGVDQLDRVVGAGDRLTVTASRVELGAAARWRHRPRPSSSISSRSPLEPTADDLHIVVCARVPERRLEQEAVDLGLGQGERALELDRVLGGQHHERLGQRMGHPVHGDLTFLHGLQQSGLGLRWGPVDLVAEYHIVEHRPGSEVEATVRTGRRAGTRSRRTASDPG